MKRSLVRLDRRLIGSSERHRSSRLDERFRLLTGGSRIGLERHRTLRAAVTWSYDLLAPEERLVSSGPDRRSDTRRLARRLRERSPRRGGDRARRSTAHRGDRLAFNMGIIVLAIVAAVLIVAFQGSVDSLIPLYTVGVFVAFTLSQTGMVRHWWRLRTQERTSPACDRP